MKKIISSKVWAIRYCNFNWKISAKTLSMLLPQLLLIGWAKYSHRRYLGFLPYPDTMGKSSFLPPTSTGCCDFIFLSWRQYVIWCLSRTMFTLFYHQLNHQNKIVNNMFMMVLAYKRVQLHSSFHSTWVHQQLDFSYLLFTTISIELLYPDYW